jgi:hypothetical protein
MSPLNALIHLKDVFEERHFKQCAVLRTLNVSLKKAFSECDTTISKVIVKKILKGLLSFEEKQWDEVMYRWTAREESDSFTIAIKEMKTYAYAQRDFHMLQTYVCLRMNLYDGSCVSFKLEKWLRDLCVKRKETADEECIILLSNKTVQHYMKDNLESLMILALYCNRTRVIECLKDMGQEVTDVILMISRERVG